MPKGSDLLVAALENAGASASGVPGEENLDVVESFPQLQDQARSTRRAAAAFMAATRPGLPENQACASRRSGQVR
jgi:thiamine pyrophosphate-dependent acetolactate synthase large subunit-like protein